MASQSSMHRDWWNRFQQQFRVLYWKNALHAWRNWKSTSVRLAAPFIFMLLVWLIDKALQANESSLDSFKVLRHPEPELIKSIPRCGDDLYMKSPCYSFLYSTRVGDGVSEADADTAVDAIVESIRTKNDPVIERDDVIEQSTPEAVNEWFLANPERALGAVHFVVSDNLSRIDFTLQSNSTPRYFKGDFQDPNFFFQIPFQVSIQRAISAYHMKKADKIDNLNDLNWRIAYKDFPHPALDTDSFARSLLGPFLFAANMFGVVTQTNAMVAEKQSGMKQALRTMGMLDSAYWSSWAVWEISLNLFTSLLNVVFGLIFQFKFFLENNFFLVFLLLFLFQLSMVGVGFVMASLISRVVVATLIGFMIFITGWVTFTVQQFDIPYSSQYFGDYMYITVLFTMMPWNVFMKGVNDLSQATSNSENTGLDFSQRFSYCRDERGNEECENEAASSRDYIDCECVLPLGDLYWILLVLFIGYILLAMYIEKVIPNEYGVRLDPWFIFDPRYWGYKLPRLHRSAFRMMEVKESAENGSDPDVEEEHQKMKASIGEEGIPISQSRPVELFGLQKRFSRSFFAIKGSWFAIDQGELFCLLGPNGAGKTTTINCLTGALPPDGGAAFIYGESITETGGMDAIRAMMGVCPQFDVLWKDLTGDEHLIIFGFVKGIPAKNVPSEAEELLRKTALTHASNQRAGTYSGGMKRRLSVAIALLGNPKIVFLDEPTTGMDPISRRYVWDIIESAKPGRAIVLTTHSMEEADILGDRISIMAKGNVRAIGSSIRLKQRFGAGYSISVSVDSSSSSSSNQTNKDSTLDALSMSVKAFFMESLGVVPREENRAYITFLVPRDKEPLLPRFLQELENRQQELRIGDIHLSLTTLEEVFLNIARTAEIEALKSEGISRTLLPFTDGTQVEIGIGQETFVHPVTGVTYAVHWGQTDDGSFRITDAEPVGEVPEGTPDPNLSALN
eukprot:g888.t1